MPGWHGSTRRRRLRPDWPKIRAHILERDHHQCQVIRTDTGRRCLAPARQVHHLDADDSDDPAGMCAICDWHHQRISSSQGGRRIHRSRPDPLAGHPGIIG